MASTSASSSVQKRFFKYDVFLSFRGEDTRKTFVDHLYHALDKKGIVTYKDDEKIKKGEKINEQLITSIKESRFYIIVFSKNYASSSWCLDELVEIMECQKSNEQTAYPVFFDVEPTEVRNQSGVVGEAFAKHVRGCWSSLDSVCSIVASCCSGSSSPLNGFTMDLEKEDEDDIGIWRNALKEAAGLAGMELKNTFNGHEAKFIQQIVEMVSLKLHFFNSSVDGKLVGMETRVKNVVSSLELGSDDVRTVGIKGMGGGGKTTLARAVFDYISVCFEGKSFVENVKEGSKGYGLIELQKQVLQDVLNDQKIDVKSIYDGKNMMKKMMCNTKVLVVLDDVDDTEQLEALAGELGWFKPGSRIIITTRDEQVLVAHRANFIHYVSLLSHDEAICLFSRYAFETEIPIQGYKELSGKVVHYAAGLPLTIKVLGSHLCGRSKSEWKDVIERLKRIPLKKTLEKLELSYNGLENDEKEIFLDVVCILKGEMKNNAIKILQSSGFNAHIGLRVLEQKSLITISEFNGLGFHDHIEEMGRNIVRHLHPDKPKSHSRLWINEEIEDILVNELGNEEIKCMKLKYMNLDPSIIMKGLRKMKELRFLYVETRYRTEENDEDNQYLPDALRSLYWNGYPFCWLPKTFQANKLVNLEMPWSNITQLWEGGESKVVLNQLKFLDLSYSNLRTFDLGMTPHLEELNLEECDEFVELHVPFEFPYLKCLNLSSCKVSSLNLGLTPNLERLDLDECVCLEEIHAPVGCLKKVVYTRFNCFNIIKHGSADLDPVTTFEVAVKPIYFICQLHPNNELPKFGFECKYDEMGSSWSGTLEHLISFGLCTCIDFKYVSATVWGLQHLRELTLESSSIPEVPKDLWRLERLEKLTLDMEEIQRLPDNIYMLKHLKYLRLICCACLEQFPENICRLEWLEDLHIWFCETLRGIPTSISKMKRLKCLHLFNCTGVKKLPEELGHLECLKELSIYDTGISLLPQSIYQLKGLHIIGSKEQLHSYGFTKLSKFPSAHGYVAEV